MKKSGFSFILFFVFSICLAQAQEMRVTTFDFGTEVQDRELVGMDSIFVSTVGTIYCYTRVEGAIDKQQVVHRWYYEDQQKASITLPVESSNWRTWSSKSILENWVGNWRVTIEDGNGNVLASKAFVVESME